MISWPALSLYVFMPMFERNAGMGGLIFSFLTDRRDVILAYMQYLNQKLILIVFSGLSFGVIACISPRENCEEYRSLNSQRQSCLVGFGNVAECHEQLALGAVAQAECERTEIIMIYSCWSYANDSERCSKELDLPLVPKIVNRHLKPDAADFIRWRMARIHRSDVEGTIGVSL